MRSRNLGSEPETGREGTRELWQRYYADELDLTKTLRELARRGVDARHELFRLGHVLVGRRGHWKRYLPEEAMRLVWPEEDISPPHHRDRSYPEKEESTG